MLLLRSRTFKGFESHRDAEFQCMFWCMLAFDITASLCDILQSRSGAQIFCHVWVMRIRAFDVQRAATFQGLDSKPAEFTLMGVRFPLPAPT